VECQGQLEAKQEGELAPVLAEALFVVVVEAFD
jgi:hypothetical protein